MTVVLRLLVFVAGLVLFVASLCYDAVWAWPAAALSGVFMAAAVVLEDRRST